MDTYRPDHYRLLGVGPRADPGEIKNSYRKLSRVYHPDLQGGSATAADCFKQIASAYADLSDPQRRLHYDRLLLLQDPLRLVDDPRAGKALDVLDLVVTRLRRRPALPDAGRARDLRVQKSVPYGRAMLGGTMAVEAAWPAPCDDCHGQGTVEPARNPVCHVCAGHGTMRVGLRRKDEACGFCGGRGAVLLAPCAGCAGAGTVEKRRTVEVTVPPRTRDRTKLRVRGHGETGSGKAGDLVVDVRVVPHPLLSDMGDDLLCTVPVTWSQLAQGARLPVPTLEGSEFLTLPPGTPIEREFRIGGRGLPVQGGRSGQRGALRVKLHLDVPTDLPPALAESLRQIEERLGPSAFSSREGYLRTLEALAAEAEP
jgi:molecular chaperone DnaJ